MAKAEEGTFWSELASASLYKRNQGRLSRQLTAGGLSVIVAVGAWILSENQLGIYDRPIKLGVPMALAALGFWLAFRAVNYPKFAEFLISVEGEMNKVAWSSKKELYRSTIVVLVVMVFMGLMLCVNDMFWRYALSMMGVLNTGD